MKHLLTFIICVFLTATAYSQSVDTLTSDEWKSNAWSPDTRIIYNYNSQCQPVTLLVQSWQSGTAVWADTLLMEYQYDVNQLISQATTKIWNSNTSVWDNGLRQTYSYDVAKNNDSLLTEVWASNQWTSLSLTTNYFNPDATTDISISQIWAGALWFNSTKSTYSYNADKTVNQAVTERWLINSWKNDSRNTYTYNAQAKVLTEITDTWKNAQWKNSARITNTYDGSSYLTYSLSETFNTTTSLWENFEQTNYTNNGDGTASVSISQGWNKNTSAWVNKTRGTYHYTDCTLPINLLDFTAAPNGKTVQLEWTTSTEINSRDFVVQRSHDGSRFENIGTVNATGNSTVKTAYQFTDAGAMQAGVAKVYYRLQMNDKDGKYANSKVVTVNLVPRGKSITIYPNPVKDQLNITFNVAGGQYTIRIIDQNGKPVYERQFSGVQQGSRQQINTSILKSGVYYLQAISGNDVQSAKFFKQ